MSRIYFFWDPLSDNILQERDESGTVTAEYTTEPGLYGNLISQNRGGVESQYHFDPQGSTLALTDDDQQVTDNYAYSAFGEVTDHSGSTVNPFQYIGRQGYYRVAATGLLLVRRRTYALELARWLSRDPLALSEPRQRGTSEYRYCDNRPLTKRDPSGLSPCEVRSWNIEHSECGVIDGTFGVTFISDITFQESRTNKSVCVCWCCSYRQLVAGEILQKDFDKNGDWGLHSKLKLGDVNKDPPVFAEDCLFQPNGVERCYGHRGAQKGAEPSDNDYYSSITGNDGCLYHSHDRPGSGVNSYQRYLGEHGVIYGQIVIKARFRLLIVDTCVSSVNTPIEKLPILREKAFNVDCTLDLDSVSSTYQPVDEVLFYVATLNQPAWSSERLVFVGKPAGMPEHCQLARHTR